MKFIAYAIVDRKKEPYRPSLVCLNRPREVVNGILKTPAQNFVLTFDQSGVSNVIRDDHPNAKHVLEVIEGVYKSQLNPVEKRPVLIGPFDGATAVEARNAAIKEQLKLRDKSPEEVAALAEQRAKEAEATVASRDAEIEELKAKLADKNKPK